MMDIKGLASMVNKVFDKKLSGGGVKSGNMLSQELAEELYKPTIRKLKKRTFVFYRQYLACWACWYAINN